MQHPVTVRTSGYYMRHLICLLVFFAALAPAYAQVFKCTSSAGHVSYSDQPCSHGHSGALLARERSWQDIVQERHTAAQAEMRKERGRAAERQRRLQEDEQRRARQLQASAQQAPRLKADTPECRAAKKDLDFVASIQTLRDGEKRARMNSATVAVNVACGLDMPLERESSGARPYARPQPTNITHCVPGFCYDNLGTAYHRQGPDFMATPAGRRCHRTGSTWNCF